MKKTTLSFLLGLFISVAGFSQDATDTASGQPDTAGFELAMLKLDSTLQAMEYVKGMVILSDNLATISVPEGFAFLEAKNARYVLEDAWNNPKDDEVLGLMVPENTGLLDGDSWAVVYSYEEDGHVNDDDASSIKYDELLEDMKKEALAANPDRVKEGYDEMEIIGWAKAPYYDQSTHKLHWAKTIRFGADSIPTLNYNIRMLGRKGVLVMNVIAGMDNMDTVESNIHKILASTNFNAGNRYEDYDESVDKVATYGIGGLIAGGVLAKTGILAKLGIVLLKGWKLISLALIGVLAFLRGKFFKSKS